MRFSLLTLNLRARPEPDRIDKLYRIARYIVEENISCVCLQECRQAPDAELVDDGPLRADNTGYLMRQRLVAYGLKYEIVWAFSHRDSEGHEEGSAILTQLPILGSCSRYVSSSEDADDDQSRNVIMARLAAAPNAAIDVYSVHLSPPEHGLAQQIESLVNFVQGTPEVLEQMKPPPPKRRGPPRRRVPGDEAPITTRLICVAGDFNEGPEGEIRSLPQKGYLEASSIARQARPGTGTFRDGRWIDYVFIKPALRPQSARIVFNGDDRNAVSDHHGIVVELEI